VDFPAGIVGAPWNWLGHLVYIPVLLWALYRAPWWRIRHGEGQHLFLGACALAVVLWSIRAGVTPGLNFHLLGASLITLMFGWEFAIIILSIALAGITGYGRAGWDMFSLNGVMMILLPVLVSYRIFLIVDRKMPNFFIYVLACGFFGAGLTVAIAGLVAMLVLWLGGVYSIDHLANNYLPYFPLLMFPEGFLNGWLTAVLVGFKPHWMRTFRDERYIDGK